MSKAAKYRQVVGTYRASYQFQIVASQAAASRVWEVRNSHATNRLLVTRLSVQWLQTAAHTAALTAALEAFKYTGFSVVDPTDSATFNGTSSSDGGVAAPGSAQFRGVTASGVAAGMTGGTLTKSGAAWSRLRKWMLLAVPTAGENPTTVMELVLPQSPWTILPDEGIVIENAILLGVAAGSTVNVDVALREMQPY